jgi:RNA polymerase sigma factor (sigma-70 family)
MSVRAAGGHEAEIRRPRVPARLLRLASDERLVDALRGGNQAAFEVIYTRHHRGVLSFCRHMLGSVEEAEDALQHTFLAAYRDLLRSDKPIHLRAWLYAIARNRCLSVLRSRRDSVDEPIEPSTEHLSHEVEQRHDLRALLGDLSRLAPDQRAALVLAELGDMSHDEIGAVLGCPKEKVKALVFQARSSLIASRTARETSCADIREQLANLRGGSLRRNTLRRHLRDCPGCRDYRDQVLAQRSALAMILPVAPTLGLKATVLGAAGVTAAAGGGTAIVASAVVAVCVAGGGTAAVDIARDDDGKRPAVREPRPARVVPAAVAPATASVERRAAPKTRRGTSGDGRHETKRRRNGAERGVKAERGKGANPEAARPAGAQGPKPKAARPLRARGPKPKASRPVRAQGPKPKAVTVRGPKPKVEKAARIKVETAPKVKPAKPEKARGPKPKAEEPVAPADPAAKVPPGQAKKAG